MIEDYYGFSSYGTNTMGIRSQRSAQRTQRSPRLFARPVQSPPAYRTLKRTELSKEKLKNIQNRRNMMPALPQLHRQQTSRDQQSYQRPYQDESSANRQQFEVVAKKYDNYMRTESIEFINRDISRTDGPAYPQERQYRPDSRQPPSYDGQPSRYQNPNQTRNINYPPAQMTSLQYDRPYRSSSRGKQNQFITRFQHQQPIPVNAIDRVNKQLSRSQTPRHRKPKSLSNSIKRQHAMHTFYPADRMKFFDYNDEGYRNQKQERLKQVLEERARRAFERAVYDEVVQRREVTPKRPSKPKKFQVQDNSRMQHKNSGILDDLNDNSRYNGIMPVNTRRPSNKEERSNYHQERVVDVSIDPRKEQHNDEYQIRNTNKNIHQLTSNHSISRYLEDRSPSIPSKNVIAAHNKEQQSFLVFKPAQKKQQPIQIPQQNKDFVKRSSQLSDYRSIDMMQLNSNCNMNKEDLKQKQKQIQKQKQRIEYASDDNKSLGIDTIRSYQLNKKKKSRISNVSNSRQSSIQSQSQSNSQYSSYNSNPSTNKLSKSGSVIEVSPNAHNFSRNKLKNSHSMSQVAFGPVEITIHQPPPSRQSHVQADAQSQIDMNKKQRPLEVQPSKINSQSKGNSSQQNSSGKKIRRLKKANPSVSDSNQSIPKIQSMSILGMQSIPQFSNVQALQTLQLKINPIQNPSIRPMSKIDQAIEKSKISPQNSKLRQRQSKIKSRQSLINSNKSHSVVDRSKLRSIQQPNENSMIEYDLFLQLREFMEEEENDYHFTRKQKERPQLISEELDDVLSKIEEHLYLLTCIFQLIIMVPDVYDFQTIYNKENQWIFGSIYLTLKKTLYQRIRVADALNGGKNCFMLMGCIIQDAALKKHINHPYVRSIYTNLVECNVKLSSKMKNFHTFLGNFKKQEQFQAFYALKPFNNSEQLGLLLSSYDREIDNLKRKRVQEFKDGNIPQDDYSEYDMLVIVNERIFRMMEVGFILANLAGKEVKAIQKEQDLFRQQEGFKDYLFENEQLFKQMIMIFK